MFPQKAKFEIEVEQVKDIEAFRQPSGRRSYGMAYYLLCEEKVMVVHCISDHTDLSWLKDRINEGRIYIQTKKT
jgi:hypothetical protein